MKRLGHIILSGLIQAISRLPFGLLYILADAACFVMYRVVRYRCGMVKKNLRNSFPQMTDTERKLIEKQFYRNFADYIFETIKYKTISYEKLSKHIVFENMALIDRHFAAGKSIVCYFSHSGNWEWVTAMGEPYRGNDSVQLGEIYRPLKDKWMDRLMLEIRTRFNTVCIPKNLTLRHLLQYIKGGVKFCIGFMSDQKPSHGDQLHVVQFLNQPTAVITGTETVARKLKCAVVYFDMTKISRGHYHVKVVPMTDDASSMAEFELTNAYFKLLEANIRRQPAIWLWSHNRWKHKLPANQS